MHEVKIGQEAVQLADNLETVLRGHSTASCYIAISLILGYAASLAQRPDFDGMMALVRKTARDEFDRRQREAGNG